MDRIPLDAEKRVAEVDGPIGWLRFDDPAPRNALSNEMQTALSNGLRDAILDERAPVFRGR
jgi:enoyl-CoA hydratase/carnithine racemase